MIEFSFDRVDVSRYTKEWKTVLLGNFEVLEAVWLDRILNTKLYNDSKLKKCHDPLFNIGF